MSVADREADVYEFFNEAQAVGVDLLVRASWDRRVEGPQGHIWSTLAKAPLLAQQRLQLSRSPGQRAQTRGNFDAVRRGRWFQQPEVRWQARHFGRRAVDVVPAYALRAGDSATGSTDCTITRLRNLAYTKFCNCRI